MEKIFFWRDKKKTEDVKPATPSDDPDYNFEDDENIPQEYDRSTAATLLDKILLNRPLKAILAILVLAVVIPAIIYAVMYGVEPDPEPFGTCLLLPDFWADCTPGTTVNEITCTNIGCCWNSTLSACYHTVPSQHTYKLKDPANYEDLEHNSVEMIARLGETPFMLTSLPLYLSVVARSKWQATVQLTSTRHDIPSDTIPLEESNIKVDSSNLTEGFWLSLWRRETDEILFSTENGPLLASNGYWELGLQFGENNAIFGAGSAARGKLAINSDNVTIYSTLRSTTNGRPFILCVHENGTSHGILIESPGALEIVGRTSNLVSIRSTTENSLKLQVFVGDTPIEVIKHLTQFIKRVPMPPNWAFGLHICRNEAQNDSFNPVMIYYEKATILQLPYDTDCIDELAFGNTSFQQDRPKEMNETIYFMKSKDLKYILPLFAQITNDSEAFYDAENKSLTLTKNGTTFFGIHRNKSVAYPDYTSDQVLDWLKLHLGIMLDGLISMPDGLVLPENWPLNEDKELDDGNVHPVYVPQSLNGSLSHGTVWWQASHLDGSPHHTKHSRYGSSHADLATLALREVLQQVTNYTGRLPVFTASKWNNESTWLGEEQPATWDGLKSSLLSVMEAGLSGEPFPGGGAICGSRGEWNEALCTRWSLLALSVFPTVRYHHAWGESPRDPTNMSNNTARVVAQAARLRYQLLPYLYTLAHEATMYGLPLARAMVLEFPRDNQTWYLDEQLMLGPAILIAPVLRPADVVVDVYLPKPGVAWYHLQGGEQVNAVNASGNVSILVGDSELVMLLRGGHVILMQEEAGMTTSETLSKPRKIIAALDCPSSEESNCTAMGRLYLDDETDPQYINITSNVYSVTVTGMSDTSVCLSSPNSNSSIIREIMVYGIPGEVKEPVEVNGVLQDDAEFNFSPHIRRLHIAGLNVSWCEYTSDIVIAWQWLYNVPA